MEVRLEATVHGVVQGVGFRVFVMARVARTGITGWVANGPRGEVRCIAEGERAQLELLLGDLELGPAGAIVNRVDATWGAATGGFNDFTIRSGGHSGD